jgi:hypothetical protein
MSRRRLATVVVGLLLAAAPAGATSFSFGTIAATDVITSITLAADDGSGGNTFEFDTSTNTLTITSSVTQINFANKPAISGIPIGDVIFSTQLSLSGAFSYAPPVNPTNSSGTFSNGMTDFTIWDVAGGGTSVLEADFTGGGLLVTTKVTTGVVYGELSGDFVVTGGDSDAQAAFGSTGELDQLFPVTVGSNLCNKTVICSGPGGNSGVATDWKTFEANPTSTLVPLPEPAAALLLALVAPLLAVRRRL